MNRNIAFWLLWVGFIAYAVLLAPPNQPETFTIIKNLVTGQWDEINPLIIALFNVLGIFPMVYACLLLADGRGQKIPAWFFGSVSFGVGAFALLPYLALRQPNGTFVGQKDGLLKLLDSRWTGVVLTAGVLGLLTFGLLKGDWTDFIRQFQTTRFVHVMTLDFCVLCLLFPALLGDDMARRGLTDQRIFWAVALIPLLGPLFYLMLRPPLQENLQATGELSVQS